MHFVHTSTWIPVYQVPRIALLLMLMVRSRPTFGLLALTYRRRYLTWCNRYHDSLIVYSVVLPYHIIRTPTSYRRYLYVLVLAYLCILYEYVYTSIFTYLVLLYNTFARIVCVLVKARDFSVVQQLVRCGILP